MTNLIDTVDKTEQQVLLKIHSFMKTYSDCTSWQIIRVPCNLDKHAIDVFIIGMKGRVLDFDKSVYLYSESLN